MASTVAVNVTRSLLDRGGVPQLPSRLVLGDHEPARPVDELYAELYALSGPQLYLVLTDELGWSDQQYATWFVRVALGAMTTTPESQSIHQGEPS